MKFIQKAFVLLMVLLLMLCAIPLVLAEETGMSSQTSTTTSPSPIQVTLYGYKVGNQILVDVSAADGSIPVGLNVHLVVNGEEVSSARVVLGNVGQVSFVCPVGATSAQVFSDMMIDGDRQYAACAPVDVDMSGSLGFEFREISRTLSGSKMIVKWNRSEANGATVHGVRLNDNSVAIIQDGDTLTIDVSSVLDGEYASCNMAYVFMQGGEEITLNVGTVEMGTLKTTLTLFNSNGIVSALLMDSLNRPIAEVSVSLYIGSTKVDNAVTDETGKVTFAQSVPSDTSTVKCRFDTLVDGALTYQACVGDFSTPTTTMTETTGTGNQTSTSVSDGMTTTTTNTPSIQPTTPQGSTTRPSVTYQTVLNAATTDVVNDMIAVNATYDTGIFNVFGVNNAELQDKAKLLFSQSDYSALCQKINGVPMLGVHTSGVQPSMAQINAVVAQMENGRDYLSETVRYITVDLSLCSYAQNKVTPVQDDTVEYLVQLPIPATMVNCKQIAVSFANDSVIGVPTLVTVNGGYLEFRAPSLSTFAIIGLNGEEEGSSLLIWLIIAFGLFLIVLLLLVIYLVKVRRGEPVIKSRKVNNVDNGQYVSLMDMDAEEISKAQEVSYMGEFDGEDIFSGRLDTSAQPPRQEEDTRSDKKNFDVEL